MWLNAARCVPWPAILCLVVRPRDVIKVVLPMLGEFTAFDSLELTTDLLATSELHLKIGDDGTWPTIQPFVQPGQEVRVYLNGLPQFLGRFEVNNVPCDANGGILVDLVARTKLSDAKYASADPKLSFQNVSVKDFIVNLFAPLGYLRSDFLFAPVTAVNLVTGKQFPGGKPLPDLEPVKADQLKVTPPETIDECAKRVLKRFHLMLWDSGFGKLIVGKPDDTQKPFYKFNAARGAAAAGNNCLSLKRAIDWSEVPSEVDVFGGGFKKDVSGAPIKAYLPQLDVFAVAASTGHFNRRVILADTGAKTLDQAMAKAKRELASRSKTLDGWEATLDGWTYWDGATVTPIATNTTAEVNAPAIGPGSGLYLVHKLTRTFSAADAATINLSLAAPNTYADL